MSGETGEESPGWYHLDEGEQRGPVSLPAMRRLILEGDVRSDTYVWTDGMHDWMRARDVPALVPPPERRGELAGW